MFQNFKDSRKMANSLKGIFSVYKEKGMTSVDVLRFLRLQIEDDLGLNTKMYGVRFGHGGILDQSSCGVLAVALGSKCKKLKWFYEGDKKYSAIGCLGVSTDTYDTSGNITGEKPFDIHCSGGFFVRSFIHDLGLALGSFAHMLELERTQHGPFTIKDALHQYQWSYAEVMEAITKADQMCKEYFIKKIR
ncbi:pseudouridylate synthase TRUB1-like isoform X3 [Tachypleus tridentatus]|uniref:pseudouridylate synthase TRUB1-like isoform X3 n=1 Tax=Tachypleus tridentatus TaxID=6853 RepID=UPI003FD5559D